jgi:hypothetical protein
VNQSLVTEEAKQPAGTELALFAGYMIAVEEEEETINN